MQGGLHAALPSISGHWSLIALTFFHLPAGICSPVRREVTRPARGVELRQQNGFAGLNPSWSRKAFLASLQRCPSYCGKVLSTAHHCLRYRRCHKAHREGLGNRVTLG